MNKGRDSRKLLRSGFGGRQAKRGIAGAEQDAGLQFRVELIPREVLAGATVRPVTVGAERGEDIAPVGWGHRPRGKSGGGRRGRG